MCKNLKFQISARSIIATFEAIRKGKGMENPNLTSKECSFCHTEAVLPEWEAEIRKKGYSIIEMENCN